MHFDFAGAEPAAVVVELHIGMIAEQRHRHGAVGAALNRLRRAPPATLGTLTAYMTVNVPRVAPPPACPSPDARNADGYVRRATGTNDEQSRAAHKPARTALLLPLRLRARTTYPASARDGCCVHSRL